MKKTKTKNGIKYVFDGLKWRMAVTVLCKECGKKRTIPKIKAESLKTNFCHKCYIDVRLRKK